MSGDEVRSPEEITDAQRALSEAEEWRIHYHVPIFVEKYGMLQSTRDDILRSLGILLEGECSHFEIETYTWDVLPDELKVDLRDSIEREFRWVLDQIEEN